MEWDFISGTAEHRLHQEQWLQDACEKTCTCRPYLQWEPCPGSTCCLSQQVWETPIPFWVQDHVITLIPCLPPDPAARAGGRQACSLHVTRTAQGDGVSSPWLSQWHWLPSAPPRCGAALGLDVPPFPWWLLAQFPSLEGVLLTLFPQTRANNLDSGKSNSAMLKQKEQQIPSLHKMQGHPMAISCSGRASEEYTRYFMCSCMMGTLAFLHAHHASWT